MIYRVILLLVLFGLGIAYIDFLNPTDVDVVLPFDYTVKPSKIDLMLGSAGFGALMVLFAVYIKATSEFFRNWKRNRDRQKDAKVDSLYSKGLNALLSRRNDLAAYSFEKALALKPDHAEALLRLGNIHYKDGNYPEAIRLHQKASHADGNNVEALFALALDYEDAKRTEDALQTLEDILEKDEGNLRALSKIRDIRQRKGEFEKAEEAQNRILKLSLPAKERDSEQARLVGLKYETGRILLEAGNLDKAKRVFKTLVKMDKDFVPGFMGLGEVYIEEGENADAATLWEDAYRITGSVILLHRLEDLYIRLGDPVKIINLYKEALHRDSSDVNLSFFLGKLYYRLEMVDDAYDILSKIDSSTMRLPDLHKLLGNIYQRRGMLSQAVDEFRKAIEFGEQLVVPYRCSHCEFYSTEWSGRCPRCGKWNTYGVDLDKYC